MNGVTNGPPVIIITVSHALVICVEIQGNIGKRKPYRKESLMRDGTAAVRLSHKQKVGGSSPSPATNLFQVGRFGKPVHC